MTHLEHHTQSFADLGVRDEIVRALADRGIEHPFAIQELTLPLALAGDDLIGQARTGMGKTFAFGVPLLHRISTDTERPLTGAPRALVVVPTRELCIQVYDDLAGAAKYLNTEDGRPFSVVSIYGGRPYEPQIESLQKGADLVVGTPGRLLDLAQQGHLQLGGLSGLVLDEADEMLDLGFLPDIERILRLTPDSRQSMLFSATMPDPIITLARTFMNQPTHIRAEAPHSAATHDTTEQFVYRAHALDKVEMVSRILQAEGRGATMIFARTKRTAQKVADELAERGFKVGAVHGDLGQAAREKALSGFRSGDVDVLVATDVAARGIDIDDITHVINYQIPDDEQAYVHRIGRTGRAGKTGIAVTLVDWDELTRWSMIDKALGLDCPDPAETYSSSPHLYEELNIPTDAKGTVGSPKKSPVKSGGRRERGSSDAAEKAEKSASSRTRAPRRRTRGGQPATGHVEGAEIVTDAPAGESSSAEGTRPRRRRRRPRKAGAPKPLRAPASHPHRMVRPERRTRADLIAAAVIAVVVAVVAGIIWWTSDARATDSRPAAAELKALVPAKVVPQSLRQLWTAPSPKTTMPVVVGGAVVTGDGRTVSGRDPVTGEVAWSYARDRELCGVTWIYRHAVAVYPDGRGCGQVTTVDGSTGRRGPTRSGYADKTVEFTSDGTTVLAAGPTRLETWRSDMVRVIGFGEVDARVKPPQVGVGHGCRQLSAAASTAAAAVLQACPGKSDAELTLLTPADQDDEPTVKDIPLKGVSTEAGAWVVTVSDTSAALYVPTPHPHVVIYDDTGIEVSNTPLPATPLPTALHPGAVSRAGGLITWWTGDSVLVFDGNKLAYRYTVDAGSAAPLGPATLMAGRLLIPLTGGIGVYEPSAGTFERMIPVTRSAINAPVVPNVAGATLLEQRGPELVALG